MTTDELRTKFENWWLRNGDPFDLHKVAAWASYQAGHASRDPEVEALQDAERYRWLREKWRPEWTYWDELDQAIDAAMREESK